jgi:hypothetical protein
MSTVGGPRLSTIPTFQNTYSMDFDGVDDYIDLGTESTVADSGQFTLSFWIKSSPATGNNIFNVLFSSEPYYNLNRFWVMSGANIQWVNINNVPKNIAVGVLDNTWHHIMIIWNPDGANSTIRSYIDGANEANAVTDYRYAPDWNGGAYQGPINFIGGNNIAGYKGVIGTIDEFAAFEGDRSADLASIYNKGVPANLNKLPVPPLQWFRMGDNGSYKSPQWLIPNNENKDKVSNYSFEFDGIDDYIDIGNEINFEYNDAFSYSFWVNPDVVSGVNYLYSKYHSSGRGILIYYNSNGAATPAAISLGIFNTNSGSISTRKRITTSTGNILTKGMWNNIVITYDGSGLGSGIKLYKNGVSQTVTVTQDNLQNSTILNSSNSYLGAFNGTGSFLTGKLDEFSIYNSELSSDDALTIYNSGTPTTISGAIAHYKMGEEANFTSNWLVDNSALDNYSKRSFAFDGIDDYIELGSLSNLQNATEYSISSWFKSPLNNLYQVIWGWFDGADGYLQLLLISDGSFVVYNYRTSTAYGLSSTGLVSADTWYNALVVFDGSGATNSDRLKLYINGSLITLTYTGTIPTQTGTMLGNGLHLGAYVTTSGTMTWELEGNIDEVSIFNSAISIADVWNGSGEPIDVSAVSGIVGNYRMGEDASFNGTNWTIPDNVGTNNGTSNAMTVDDLVGESPNYTGGGISEGMDIEDRVGNAPNSDNNTLSINMEREDRVEDTP